MNVEDQLDPSIAGFVKPNLEFAGITLQTFSPGRKILFHQATISQDGKRNSGEWVAIALLYLLTLKPEEARKQAFSRERFQENALAWFDGLSATTEEAMDLANKILSNAEQTKVEVGGTGGTDPKNA